MQYVRDAVARGAAAVMAERAPEQLSDDRRRRERAQCAARAGPGRGPALSAPARHHRGGHRHQRQDIGRGLRPPDLDRARSSGGEHRHGRHRLAEGRRVWLADDARSGRSAPHARRARRRRRDASGAGSVLARVRPASPRRRARRGRRLHQPVARPHGLPPDHGGLPQRQAASVRDAGPAGWQRRDRRRPRRGRGRSSTAARARGLRLDHGGPERGGDSPGRGERRRLRAAPRARP